MIILGLKVVFLFMAVMFTFVNVLRTIKGMETDTSNFIIQAVGITGFITLQYLI